jgi:type VI secretion system protein ImpB
MAGEKVELTVAVKDRLSDTPGEEMAVRLKFQSVSDFTPDAIAETVPELKQLLEIREALTWLRSPLGNRREFRKLIENLIRDAASRERLFRELGIEDESKSGGI